MRARGTRAPPVGDRSRGANPSAHGSAGGDPRVRGGAGRKRGHWSILIPFLGAANVLYVDAATYLVAFLLVLVFVPRRKAIAAGARSGVLAGLRFLAQDRLLALMAAVTVFFGFLGAGLSAGLPVYACDEFDGSARIAGLFYAALGAGALVGSLTAALVVKRVAPLRLAAFGIVAFSIPLWVLPFLPPWPVVFLAR